MSDISIDEVKKLALLSRISISDEEAKKLAKELSSVLDYVEQLNKIDTQGVQETSQVTGLENVVRRDKEIDYKTTREALLSNAPDQEDGYIKVRRVL